VQSIGLVYPRANLDTVPSLTSAAEMLAERGYSVDIYTYLAAGQAPPRFASSRVQLRSLGIEGVADASTAGLRAVARRAGWLRQSPLRAPLVRGYALVGAGLTRGSRLLATRAADHPTRYRCVIGVDPDGLALAHRLAHGAPVVYYSLELLLSNEVSSDADRRLKEQERRLLRQAPFVIVQDAERGRLLVEDNELAWERLVLVPNAPPGPARRRRSDFWRQRFGLGPDRRVVLHSGSLGAWTGIENILASVPAWPDGWVLVIHTRYDAESSSYVDGLRAKASDRVFFSLKPVPRGMLDDLVDGADVGLAFYVPTAESAYTQSNIQTIGLSSGKLAYYLRAGLPVIVNAQASVSGLLEASGCGRAVADAGGIADGLRAVAADYDARSRAACAFFEQHLDIAQAFEAVIERIEALPG
jgi:hypothetical protein